MSEFGHFGSIVPGFGCIDSWGAGPFVIVVGIRHIRFEDSDRFGPLIVNRQGEPLTKQPDERNPFWAAHYAWKKQGRRLEADGTTCIWEPLKPTKVIIERDRRGRRFIVETVEEGDEDAGYEEVFRSPQVKP